MQNVGGQMNAARQPCAANAVSSPGQRPGEAGRHEHDGKFQEVSAALLLSGGGAKQTREQRDQEKPD